MQKDFITVTPDSGSGNATVTVKASENTEVGSRKTEIIIAAAGLERKVIVRQGGIATYTYKIVFKVGHNKTPYQTDTVGAIHIPGYIGNDNIGWENFNFKELMGVISGDYEITYKIPAESVEFWIDGMRTTYGITGPSIEGEIYYDGDDNAITPNVIGSIRKTTIKPGTTTINVMMNFP